MLLGLVQPPLFDLNWPLEWNYGGIGVIVGHEIIHGFGKTEKINKNGVLNL